MRTILVAEVNSKKAGMDQVLAGSGGQLALSDEQIWEVNEHFLARDIEEFRKKFWIDVKEDVNRIDIQNAEKTMSALFVETLEEKAREKFQIWYRGKRNTLEEQYLSWTEKKEQELGIKQFFDENRGELLILNQSLDSLMQKEAKMRFSLLLATVNEKKDESQKVHNIMVPEMELEKEFKEVRQRFKGNQKKERKQEQWKELVCLCEEHHISFI